MNRTFSFLTAVFAVALIGAATVRVHTAQSQGAGSPSTAAPTAAANAADNPAKATQSAGQQQSSGGRTKEKASKTVDPDRAYKANCTRCHSELPKLEARAMKTVLMHMRVRANLTDAEARAIADYLTR